MQRRSPACTHPPAPHGSHMTKKKTHLVEDEQLRSLPAVEECIELLRVGLVAHEALERVIRQPGRECVLNFGLAPFVPRGELGHAAENSLPSRHWFHKRCRRCRRLRSTPTVPALPQKKIRCPTKTQPSSLQLSRLQTHGSQRCTTLLCSSSPVRLSLLLGWASDVGAGSPPTF